MREQEFIEYICKKNEKLEMKNICKKENISRYTTPIMSEYIENAVASLIDNILKEKGKKYNYMIDVQLSCEKKTVRPDIIIYDDKNKIHGVIEVKSQLGYAGKFDAIEYNKRIDRIKLAGKNNNLKIKDKKIEKEIKKIKINGKMDSETKKNRIKSLKEKLYIKYTTDNKITDAIVIFTTNNDHGNIKRFKRTNYYVLFDDSTWYDNLSKEKINNKQDGHGYKDFIKYIENNF